MGSRSPDHEACCRLPSASCPCPACGNAGRKVSAVTLDHHVPGTLRAAIGNDAAFCPNPACEVVYSNPEGFVIRKGQTLFPVTSKDPGDEVRVCYCFDFKRADLRRELAARGKTGIPDRIKKGIAEGRCDCERKNPQGACCLGNVAAAIKTISEEPASR